MMNDGSGNEWLHFILHTNLLRAEEYLARKLMLNASFKIISCQLFL